MTVGDHSGYVNFLLTLASDMLIKRYICDIMKLL